VGSREKKRDGELANEREERGKEQRESRGTREEGTFRYLGLSSSMRLT